MEKNCRKVKIKINRYMLEIGNDDYILDNGSCIQVPTKNGVHLGFHHYAPVIMSKKLFKELKNHNYIFVDEQLTTKANKKYTKPFLTYYCFDIDKMIASSDYEVVEPNINDNF